MKNPFDPEKEVIQFIIYEEVVAALNKYLNEKYPDFSKENKSKSSDMKTSEKRKRIIKDS